MAVLERTKVPGVEPLFRGKVRDIYDLGERLLLVATDRISAFDVILEEPIPEKGAILTAISAHWFELLRARGIATHFVAMRADDLPPPFRAAALAWGPRIMVVEKLRMIPIECVARGYLAGSGLKEYRERGSVCGIPLGPGLVEGSELPVPIFTPATKETTGHDVNISFEEACARAGRPLMESLRRSTLEIYAFAREYARERGVILADTKFEFGLGLRSAQPVLADEVLTPDSSRYWPLADYRPGAAQPSYDKQFVRDFLTGCGWNLRPPPPSLPAEVIAGTAARYREIHRRLTGRAWNGKGNG